MPIDFTPQDNTQSSGFGFTPATSPSSSDSIWSSLAGGVKTAANLVLSPLENTGVRFGQGLARVTGSVAGALGDTGLQQHIEQNLAKPQTNFTGGQVSPLSTDRGTAAKQVFGQSLEGAAYTAPVGTLAKGAKAGLEGLGVASKFAAPLANVGTGAGLGYAFDKGNQLEQGQNPTLTPGLGTALGAGLPLAGTLTGALLKHLTGFTSGAGSDVVQQAFDNPKAVQSAINDYASNPEAKQTLVDRMKAGISSFLQDRSQQYGDTLGSLPTNGDIQPHLDTLQSFENNVGKYGGSVTTKDGLQFADSTLTKTDQSYLKQAYEVVNNWKDTSTSGMDRLRQALGNLMDEFKLAGNTRANTVLGNVVSDLKSSVEGSAPGYTNMLSTYGKQTKLAKDVLKELSLGGNAKPSTQLNAVMRLFQRDPLVKQKVAAVLGDKADQFMSDLAGSILSEWLPEGKLMNALRGLGEAGAAGAGFAAGGAPGAAAALPGLAAMSPRIVGESAIGAGALNKLGAGPLTTKAAALGGSKLNQ